MKTNYIFIDYENIQPELPVGLEAEHFRIFLFVGENQKKISFETVAAVQRLGAKAQYIKISGCGADALDFHIAFYIGKLSTEDPKGYFHIVSKDKGFDPLIQHLKDKKIFAARSEDIGEIPAIKIANTTTPEEKIAMIVTDLQHRGTSKPQTVKTLSSTINAIFLKSLTPEEINALVKALEVRGTISLNGTKVSYNPPKIDD